MKTQLKLKDNPLPPNVFFSLLLGNQPFIRSVNPFLKKKDELVTRLKDHILIKYIANCKGCEGKIRFVNNKSLSRIGRKEFLDDSQIRKKFKGKLKDVIFFTLTEKRNDQEAYSRWLILKDGTMILWHNVGKFLFNLPKKMIDGNDVYYKILSTDFVKKYMKFDK